MTDTRQALARAIRQLEECKFFTRDEALVLIDALSAQPVAGAVAEPVTTIEHTEGGSIQYGPTAAAYKLPHGVKFNLYVTQAAPAQPVATEASKEIQELRAQVEAWRKQCDTLIHQVICCGVAARHPDATLTTRGAYAGKWNSPQAEEVRKLRAERDALLAASPHPEPSAQGEPVAWKIVTVGGRYFFEDKPPQDCYSEEWLARCQLVQPLYASAPSTPPHAVVEAVPQAWPIERAADMLTAYAEMVKATGRYAEKHYIPEIENVAAELRGIAPKAAQEKT